MTPFPLPFSGRRHGGECDCEATAVPIPVAGGIDRRQFLAAAGATAGAAAATVWLRPSALFGSAGAATTENIVVHVFLRGGADGLSILAPVGDPAYQTLRPGIAVPDTAALPVDATFGLHPAATRLHGLLGEGRLALIPAAGSPNPSRSHFEAQDLIEKGTPTTMLTPDGWLGRYLNGSANATESPLRGISVGNGLQASLRGSPAIATPNLNSLTLTTSGTWASTSAQVSGVLSSMYGAAPDPLLRAQSGAALSIVDQMSPIAASSAPPTGWPGGFGQALWPIAKLIVEGFPIEVATADFGGWDLHDRMGSPTDTAAPQHRQIAGLDAALGAFFDHIGAAASRVTVVVMTEFGRRIRGNDSGGTDHGRGLVMLVAGGGVSGGVKGRWPGLVDTDSGDVRVVNDYRLVMAEVLASRLRPTDLNAVFPGIDASPGNWLDVIA